MKPVEKCFPKKVPGLKATFIPILSIPTAA